MMSALCPSLISPSIFYHLTVGRVMRGSSLIRVFQTSVSQQTFPAPLGGIPVFDKICSPSGEFWVYPWVSSQLDAPEEPQKGEAPRRDPNQMPEPPQLAQSSSGSTLSSLRMSTLLTLPLQTKLCRKKTHFGPWYPGSLSVNQKLLAQLPLHHDNPVLCSHHY